MKIGIVSDIHGNLAALEAVLADIFNLGCEKILFLGDYVLGGPEPSDTLNFCMSLSERNNIEMIQGNTDRMISEYSEKLYDELSKSAPVMANALKDDVNILSANQKKFLLTLPEYKELTFDGVKVLMVHGSPRKNNENIFPDTPINIVEEMISGADADLILCGHTHIPCGFQTTTKQTVVNAGSVGRPLNQNIHPCYVILTINTNGEFEIEHKFSKYDNYQAAKTLASRTFDGANKLAELLISPNKRHI